jgi:hypothetical protein
MSRCLTFALAVVAVLVCRIGSPAEQFEIGGPLAGMQLDRFPTVHGEPPGYPGCIPELMEQGESVEDMGQTYRQWGPQGQAPEWHLYDGSVEHWRAYMFKYMPIRSFFDRQSQLKNFEAPDLPGAEAPQVETYAAPVYWVPRHKMPLPTGRSCPPIPVVRMKKNAPVLRLDLGHLDHGLYAVRVIGAVETDEIQAFRKPLFMRMTVNDGLDGQTHAYRLRLGYCDEFYSVAEFYFHAPQRRRYQAELAVDRGSTVDLLVHNISLDDVLAGTIRHGIKSQTTVSAVAPVERQDDAAPQALSQQDRLARDLAIWNAFPPENTQGSSIRPGQGGCGAIRGVHAGSAELSGEQITEQFGSWVPPDKAGEMRSRPDWSDDQVFLANPKLGLVYSLDDLRHNRPLPDPYPLKDDGAGRYFPDSSDPGSGAAWTPIGNRVHELHRQYYMNVGRSLQKYKQSGSPDDAHDAAITLVRYAYAFPRLDFSEYLSNTVHDPGPFGRDASCRRRFTAANFLPHYPQYVKPIMFQYDELFDLIRDNRVLARSVERFVPWVTSPEDLTALIDTYLVQTTAKRIMRYHYHTDVVDIANLAALVGNRQVTDPWMQWLFSRTFIYPLPVAGVQDAMISGCTREGTEVVGSTYYAQGEGAARVAESLDLYLQAGGNSQYDLSDASCYPKPNAHAYWRLDNVVAGGDFLRIGDVCGPDKAPGHTLRDLDFARHGWRWTGDPQFAFILQHYLGRGQETGRQWSEARQAAAGQSRAPWLERRSRVMPMWAGVLESGLEHDDYRFRRAAYLRLGYGIGHHHYDSLDLQIAAHGLPMTIDGGQRPGYSVPADRTTRVHNLVQVDGHRAYRHSWATALADCPGARYLAANATPPEGTILFRRQIAMIDVDEGLGSTELPPEQQLPGTALPPDVTTANSYVLDVFRVGGGTRQTYCFHGPLNDDFQWNAANAAPPAAGTEEAEYLSRFSLMPERNAAGDAATVLQATWRMAREVDGTGAGEKEMLRKSFDPDSPPKYTRLRLFGCDDCRALRGEFVCRQWKYHFTNLMVRTPEAEQPAPRTFLALIEPYVGEPFITACRELNVADAGRDARRPVAVEVKTKNGHIDVCFADGQPDRQRSVPDADLKITGEFALYSCDAQGLRLATLVGGRILESPLIRIETEAANRRGQVTRVDYLAKKLWIDQRWPQRQTASVVETGVPDHWTSYTVTAVENDASGSALSLARGGDYFRSSIEQVELDASIITTTLRPLVEPIDHNRTGWVASDDAASTFWRAEYLGEGRFRLDGPPVTEQAFGNARVLRLWEYGVGDTVRQSTSVSLRRVGTDYELSTDVAASISVQAQSVEISRDRATWETVPNDDATGRCILQAAPSENALWLKIRW